MATLDLPNRTDFPHYIFETELESNTYQFEFRWNDRAQAWFMEMRDVNGDQIISGKRICIGAPILMRHMDPRLPRGELYVTDTLDKDVEPGLADLGGRVILSYIPSDDLGFSRFDVRV